MQEKILVIEDSQPLAKGLELNLKKEGYRAVLARDGEEGLAKARSEKPDLIILDLMLPKLSGLDVCRALRSEGRIPIIMLTAKAEDTDELVGLELGADDYITKPFDVKRLLARIKAVLRRASGENHEEEQIQVGDIVIDRGRHEVSMRGAIIALSPKEFELLELLASHRGRAMRRKDLLERVWGDDFYGDERTLDVHIRWLREKIEDDPSRPEYLLTVRGVGYKMRE